MTPDNQLFQMITGRFISQCIYVAAKIGVADYLKNGPRSTQELAMSTSTNERNLYRLLRTLASIGVFLETQKGTFELTPMGSLLQTDVHGSLRNAAIMYGSNYHVQAWGELLDSVQTGKTAFAQAHNTTVFEYFQEHHEDFLTFSKTMTGLSDMVNVPVCESYHFSEIRTVIDVGGGHGSLLQMILQKNSHLHGALFDLSPVLSVASPIDRCEFMAGNFFDLIPAGFDAYLMKFVLHDWADEQAVHILKNCRQAIPDHGKLLVIEYLVPEGNQPSPAKFIDIEMMVMTGGKERTEAEFGKLFETAGFELNRVITTPSPMVILEAVPKI